MHFTDDYGYENFLVFLPTLSSLMLDNDKKVTDWILSGTSSEKINPFDTSFEPTLSNLASGKVILKFSNSVFVQKAYSLLHKFYFKFIHSLWVTWLVMKPYQ